MLTRLVLSPGLRQLADSLFENSMLRAIFVPREVEIIGRGCFRGCSSLSAVDFQDGSRLRRIEAEAFVRSGLAMIAIPFNVEFIGARCFDECPTVSQIVFRKRLKFIAFEGRIVPEAWQGRLTVSV
jgi:hypothetical protein